MDGQNDEGDRVDDGGRVANVEAKGWSGRHEEGLGRDHWNTANRLRGSNIACGQIIRVLCCVVPSQLGARLKGRNAFLWGDKGNILGRPLCYTSSMI